MAQLLAPFAGRQAAVAADRLINHFGSLGRALAASPGQLAHVLPDDRKLVRTLIAARTLVYAGLHEDVQRTPVAAASPVFRNYLRLRIGNAPIERLHATFLTPDLGYLADDIIAEGATTHVEADLRRLLARAFEVGAHGLILAHNHPSGSAEPSARDIALTRRIADLIGSVDVRLLDHLIVGAGDIVSMRERGLL
jgi:DNA repair protein RadC